MKKLVALAGVAFLVLVATPLSAEPVLFSQNAEGTELWCNGSPCVVRYSPGGEVGVFLDFAEKVKQNGAKLIIDGDCVSACVLLADFARPNICITSRARFLVHKATKYYYYPMAGPVAIEVKGERRDPPHSPDINTFFKKRGGYPSSGLRGMSYTQALKFWPKC